MIGLVRSFIIVTLLFAGAGCGKHEKHHETVGEEWPAMDSFHMIMAEIFHPYKDSSNLEPIKMRAEELKVEADKWAQSPLPEKVNNDEVRVKLKELSKDASALADSVKTGSDEEVAALLTKIHDHFHALQEAWYDGDDKHDHHH